ncbi:MAG: 3-dehydroquinate synthase [Chloroflexi bacterium]|nr:3-dehydroquinate synthase [Chloroflexota bacterium]MCY4247937.1 3-dehydroquinate synthase [Chloroflexota bacterium]
MSSLRNIVITGFMGSGKTTVAEILAQRLGREFVDMDSVIEARTGLPIHQIFARQGEASFRETERSLALELALRRGLVVATGGGALIADDVREMLLQQCNVYCLDVSKAELSARLANSPQRPLAAGWLSLYDARKPIYARIPRQVVTAGKSADMVAAEIAALERGALYVKTPAGGYPIRIEPGILSRIDREAASLGLDRHVVVITNETVAPLYGEALTQRLPHAQMLALPDGETHKTLATVSRIYDSLLETGADRGTVLIALGGGVIGDMAGYVAATYMRGIPLLQIPTTLLSMVDSSVGGKVGVDLPQGKNLVGAFKQPRAVLIDTDVLTTLPPLQWRCGMAEVIKHGLIAQPSLLDADLWGDERAEDLVRQAVQVKIDVVEIDPYEQGIRAHLNLGHTFGHAIEKVTGYAVPHGEAVAIGIVRAARLSRNLGFIADEALGRIQKTFWQIGLPTDIAVDRERWYAAMATDKKWQAGEPRLVVLKRIGQATVVRGLSKSDIMAVL